MEYDWLTMAMRNWCHY